MVSYLFLFFVWILYELWEIKNRGLVGTVGKENMKEMQKNAKYDFCIFCIFAFFASYAIDDVRVRTHALEQCDRWHTENAKIIHVIQRIELSRVFCIFLHFETMTYGYPDATIACDRECKNNTHNSTKRIIESNLHFLHLI